MPIYFDNSFHVGNKGIFYTKSKCIPIQLLTAPILSGTESVGSTLSCTSGTYSGSTPIAYNYSWRNTRNINAEIGNQTTYVIQNSDVGYSVVCLVSAQNCGGALNTFSNFTGIIPSAFSYLFDVYAANSVTPYAAFSLRKLNSAWGGSCIRVRRASDNAETDIGFVSDVVDAASIDAFATSPTDIIHIVIVYDQTGNNRNRQTSIAVRQPHIRSSAGVIFTTNGRTAIRFNNSNHMLQQNTAWLTDGVNYASHMVYRENAAQDNILFFSSTNVFAFVASNGSAASSYGLMSSSLNKVNDVTQTITTRGQAYTQLSAKTSAIAHYSNWIPNSTAGIVNFGGYGVIGGFVWDGFYLEEVIFNNSTNVSNATLTAAVFSNQQSFYSL